MFDTNGSLPTEAVFTGRRAFGSVTDILITLIILVVIFITVAGNILVIVSYIKDLNVRRMPGNQFILSLSVTDLFVGCVSLPLYLQNFVLTRWVFGDKLCEIYTSLDYSIVTISTITIIYISLDRYWMVTKKLRYRSFQTRRRSQMMIIASWIVAFPIEFIFLLSWSAIHEGVELYNDGICSAPFMDSRVGAVVTAILLIVLPLTTIVCLYTLVYIQICRQNKFFGKNREAFQDIKGKPSMRQSQQIIEDDGVQDIDRVRQDETVFHVKLAEDIVTEDNGVNRIAHKYTGQNSNDPTGISSSYAINMAFEESLMDIRIREENYESEEKRQAKFAQEHRIAEEISESLAKAKRDQVNTCDVGIDESNDKMDARAKEPSTDPHVSDSHMQMLKAKTNRQTSGRFRIHERRKLSRIQHSAFMISTLVLVFFISWTPFAISHVYEAFCNGKCLGFFTKEFTGSLVWVNSMINPIIYAVTNPSFRKCFLRLLKGRPRSRNLRQN